MKTLKDPRPPGWAEKLLAWYCRPAMLEDLQGDLNEHFDRHCKSKGPWKARFIYIINVFKFFRPYTVRRPKLIQLFIHWIMIGSYIKTSGRNIIRNKLFSSINIFGMAISMSVGLLMIAFISDLLSYDQFHEKKDRIYRVSSTLSGLPWSADLASTSIRAGKQIRETMTGIEDLTILRTGFGGDLQFGDVTVPVPSMLADEYLFNVFTFPLIRGDGQTALKEPYSVVLSAKAAKKLFGSAEPLGQSVKLDTLNLLVTGVMKDLPKFSHFQTEAFISLSTIEVLQRGDEDLLHWRSIWQNYVYLTIPADAVSTQLQANIDKLSPEENKSLEYATIQLWLQPLGDIVLGKDLGNPIGPVMPGIVLWITGSLAFVVILSACFNYTNLSIARSIRRSREVGIRKVIGALRSHVAGQFLSEAVIISLVALALSFLLYLFLRPQFLSIAPEVSQIVSLDLSFEIFLYFVALAVAVGLIAGVLPAAFFSRMEVVKVLKDASSTKIFHKVTLRKALIVVQYTVSLIFIASTIIGYRQYKNFLTFDLGFNTANILNIDLQWNKADLVLKELREIPEIEEVSRSLMVTSIGSMFGTNMKSKDSSDSSTVWYNSVDENYLPLHGHQFLAGRTFSLRNPNANETEVIVNEQVIKRFMIGNGDPQKCLGEVINVEGRKLTIIGVLKDFHYGKVDSPIEPVLFRRITEESRGFINAKINSADWPGTLQRIDHAWSKIDKVHPLNAKFYDDQIELAYHEFSAMLKILGFLAFLAISTSSVGLLGMVVFTTETKLREMSIRKVLGASSANLAFLLTKGFAFLLGISALIALPATYLIFDQVFLASIDYHTPIGVSELFLGLIVVLGVAFLMISSQILKVAQANPAEVLKTE